MLHKNPPKISVTHNIRNQKFQIKISESLNMHKKSNSNKQEHTKRTPCKYRVNLTHETIHAHQFYIFVQPYIISTLYLQFIFFYIICMFWIIKSLYHHGFDMQIQVL